MFERFLTLALVLWLAGCTTLQSSTPLDVRSINEEEFRDRALSRADDDVQVTVAVPTANEVRELFGADVIAREIQPVWVKVENHGEKTLYLVSTASDPNCFSTLEVVSAVRGGLPGEYRDEMERHYRSMNFKNPILPNIAVSGFVFTNLDEGEKVVQVDLIGAETVKFFTFFAQIPGMRVDYRRVDFDELYPDEHVIDVSED